MHGSFNCKDTLALFAVEISILVTRVTDSESSILLLLSADDGVVFDNDLNDVQGSLLTKEGEQLL